MTATRNVVTRNFLKGLGVEGEAVESIMAVCGDAIAREVARADEWKEKFEALSKSGSDDWKNKLEVEQSAHAATKDLLAKEKKKLADEEKAHTATKAAHEEEKATEKKRQAVIAQLVADGANETFVKYCAADFDLSKVNLEEDGTIKDWETVAKPHKEAHVEIFQEADTEGASIPKPPAMTTGTKPLSPAGIIKGLNDHRLVK